MENAVDALKIAFAVFVFIIALALAFSVIGQLRATSDVIFALNDKTNEYDYVSSEDTNASNKDRIVGFETIIPTIYRYAKEQYAVTILDTSGTPIVRYDLYTEGFINEWDTVLKKMNKTSTRPEVESTFKEIKDRISIVDEVIKEDNSFWNNRIWNSMVTGSLGTYKAGNLYKVTNINVASISVGAPWGSEHSEIIKRIEADIMGTTYEKNGVKYTGKNLNQYKNRKFKEKFIEIQTSGTTIVDTDENNDIQYSLETVKGNKKLEIIYIMQN